MESGIIEESGPLESMKGLTTGADLYEEFKNVPRDTDIPIQQLELVTDGAPGNSAASFTLSNDEFQFEGF
jgi:hypothetical protein